MISFLLAEPAGCNISSLHSQSTMGFQYTVRIQKSTLWEPESPHPRRASSIWCTTIFLVNLYFILSQHFVQVLILSTKKNPYVLYSTVCICFSRFKDVYPVVNQFHNATWYPSQFQTNVFTHHLAYLLTMMVSYSKRLRASITETSSFSVITDPAKAFIQPAPADQRK